MTIIDIFLRLVIHIAKLLSKFPNLYFNMLCLRLPSLDISPDLFICSSITRPHCANIVITIIKKPKCTVMCYTPKPDPGFEKSKGVGHKASPLGVCQIFLFS